MMQSANGETSPCPLLCEGEGARRLLTYCISHFLFRKDFTYDIYS